MTLARRTVLGAGLAAVAATLTGCDRSSPADALEWAEPDITSPAAAPAATPAPSATADAGAPLPAYSNKVNEVLTRFLKPTPENPRHPGYAGAVGFVLENGRIAGATAVGNAVRYAAGPVELPPAKRVTMRPDSIFDLASLTKVYTAILALQLVDQGKLDLSAPVRGYLPVFTGAGKDKITSAMLLSHTSALPVGAKVTGFSTNARRWASVMATPLVKGGVPGAMFRYSSTGIMVLGRLVEKLTGKTLDAALRDNLTAPLGLKDTGFRPLTWVADRQRLVATDARTSRGLLRGTVHDDVCNTLGGVAGHAGIFATARDVAVIGQMLLSGGAYNGHRVLKTATVNAMRTDVNKGKPATDPERPHRTADHGLGVEIAQPWFMGKLSSPTSFGHTGFTGTSLLVVPQRNLVAVLLTNRAHPNWSWSNPDPHRVAFHNALTT